MRREPGAIVVTFVCLVMVAGCASDKDAHDSAAATMHGAYLPGVHIPRPSRLAEQLAKQKRDADADYDNTTGSLDDADDHRLLKFGRNASMADRRAIALLLRRYYQAAEAIDGPRACSFTFAPVAEAIPRDYGRSPGQSGLRGKTCAAVMNKLFSLRRQELRGSGRMAQVELIRLAGDHGFAVMRFGDVRDRTIPVRRERVAWKVDGLMAEPLP